jgi:hypothetical protein
LSELSCLYGDGDDDDAHRVVVGDGVADAEPSEFRMVPTVSSSAAASRMLRPANSGSTGLADALTIGSNKSLSFRSMDVHQRAAIVMSTTDYTLIFFSIQHVILCTLSVFLPSSFQSA